MLMTVISSTLNPYDTMVIVFVEWALFFIFPAIWMGALGWAGHRVGDALDSSLKRGTTQANAAGQSGANGVKAGAKKV